MYLEKKTPVAGGKAGHGMLGQCGVVRWAPGGTVSDFWPEIRKEGLRSLVFVDPELFGDDETATTMCRDLRYLGTPVLWTAHIHTNPSRELLLDMRLAGCNRLEIVLGPDQAVDALHHAREFGFDIRIRDTDGRPYTTDRVHYDIADREAVAEKLPNVHAVQFDLAVAYYKAGRFQDVMKPLGKAMTLGYPRNELCLNLLACLSAAKHYPETAAGLLIRASDGSGHPLVSRNRKTLDAWLKNGGDVKGLRLLLKAEEAPLSP